MMLLVAFVVSIMLWIVTLILNVRAIISKASSVNVTWVVLSKVTFFVQGLRGISFFSNFRKVDHTVILLGFRLLLGINGFSRNSRRLRCRVLYLIVRSHKPKLEVFEARLHQPFVVVIFL